MDKRRVALALLLTVALAATTGCAAGIFFGGAAAGAGAATGAYIYTEGTLETTYAQPLDQVYEATVASLKEMQIPVQQAEKDAAGAEIEATRADGTGVSIGLEPKGPESTQAAIRVGMLGDEDASRAIADNIGERLGRIGRGGARRPASGSFSGEGFSEEPLPSSQ